MIRKLLTRIMGPRYYVPLVLFITGIAFILYSIDTYRMHAHQSIETPTVSQNTRSNLQLQEIKAMFNDPQKQSRSYQVIADNNLFVPDRKAWAPPKPKDEDGEQDQEKSRRSRRSFNHEKIRLYGTTIMESEKLALVYFHPFRSDQKYRLVKEGETARDEGDRGEDVYFEVKSVSADSVTLKDFQGETFEVGLYDHKPSQAKKAPQAGQSTVIIGGKAAGGAQQASDTAGSAAQKEASQGGSTQEASGDKGSAQGSQKQDQGGQQQGGDDQKEKPKNPFEMLKELANQRSQSDKSKEEKERLVEEGKMRKVETPFGTIYRPAE